jgi:hypothetical protein
LRSSHDDEKRKRINSIWKEYVPKIYGFDLFPIKIQESLTLAQAVLGMKDHGRRVLQANSENFLGLFQNRSKCSYFLKTNECLPLKKYGIKGRCITNFHPICHSDTLVFSKTIAETMHKNWEVGRIFSITVGLRSVSVNVVFASGYTQSQLSDIADLLMNFSGVVIVVSGDDSVVKFPRGFGQSGIFGAYDMSQFDVTQSEGALGIGCHRMVQEVGYSSKVADEFYNLCKIPGNARKGDLKVTISTSPVLPTGITATTIFNSHDTAFLFLYHTYRVLEGGERPLNESAIELGFAITGVTSDLLEDMDFLKGWWIPSRMGSYIWYPLPSAIIKAGKIMRNPLEISNSKSYPEAYKLIAYASACSYGDLDESYPIFGKFLSTLKRLGTFVPDGWIDLDEKFSRVPVSGFINREDVISMIDRRYGIAEDEITHFEDLCDEIYELPVVTFSSVFDKLTERDYPYDDGDSLLEEDL